MSCAAAGVTGESVEVGISPVLADIGSVVLLLLSGSLSGKISLQRWNDSLDHRMNGYEACEFAASKDDVVGFAGRGQDDFAHLDGVCLQELAECLISFRTEEDLEGLQLRFRHQRARWAGRRQATEPPRY